MATSRFAEVSWGGDLANGKGSIDYVTSGAFSRLPVTWVARSEAPEGKTSPEELIAAAHASCFSMSLGRRLAREGVPSERLDVKAVVTFGQTDAGWRITTSELTVRGKVPGADAAKFVQWAHEAKDGCPVSQALKGNVEITIDAALVE
jgi:osmotically inducible protein OsmC